MAMARFFESCLALCLDILNASLLLLLQVTLLYKLLEGRDACLLALHSLGSGTSPIELFCVCQRKFGTREGQTPPKDDEFIAHEDYDVPLP